MHINRSNMALTGAIGLMFILMPIIVVLGYNAWDKGEEVTYSEEPTASDEQPFLWAAEVTSVSDARSRVSFDIPLPAALTGDWTPERIWAPRENRPIGSHEEVRILFENGIMLSIFSDPSPPSNTNLDGVHPDLTKVVLGNYEGQSDGPETKSVHGRTISEPGVVLWWQQDTRVHLYSNTHSKDALVEAAQVFVR